MNGKKAYGFYTILMFLSPALTLFHSLRSSLDIKLKRRLMILFITIYGSIITISESADGYYHLQMVYLHYIDLPFTQFLSEVGDIFLFKTTSYVRGDLYVHVLSYFTGTLVRLPELFFVFASFVYAYFFTGSLISVFKSSETPIKYSRILVGLAIVFVLWKNIEGINSIRTWTGAWVLFYACINYYHTKQKKYLILMLTPSLFHLAYFIMAIPAWIVLVAGVRRKLYIAIFILSFGGTFINPQTAFKGLSQTEVGQEKVEGYDLSREDYIERKLSGGESTWYKRLQVMGLQDWGINSLCFSCIFFLVYRKNMNYLESNLFSIGLLTIALSNSSWFIASLANRSATIAGIFILASVVLLLKRGHINEIGFKKAKWLKLCFTISFVFFIPFIFYQIASMIYFISFYMLLFPFIPWFTSDINYSIREFIDFIF